jgi:hypothetical protein
MIMGSTGCSLSCGIGLEAATLRQQAADVACQYGTQITLKLFGESSVSRDTLGAIKKRPTNGTVIKAFPIERQPDARKLEKAGIREEVDLVAWTPVQAWIDAGILSDEYFGESFAAIDMTRSTVILDGQEWKIADKGLATRVGEYPVHITLGLKRT